VTESLTTKTEKPWAKPLARTGWAILILATLYVCYFSHLGAIGFVGPDEPRYAWIARDMAETGDWVTPRLYGKPWFEKPPLFYWGAALCFKLFGVSEAAARLPSAISALLATLALGWLAWRLYGAETGRWLLLLLPTTVGMIGFSHAAATDMPFSGTLTIAMVCAAVVLGLVPAGAGGASLAPTDSSTPWAALVLFGFFLGLAVLAKGPAGIILCGGAIFFWAIFTKRWRDAVRLFHPVAIGAFCLTALPWYILCARRNPDFFRIFIIEHNFKRYLTPEFQHIQPFWYYGLVLLLALFPWTAIFVWTLIAGSFKFWRTRNLSPATVLLLAWSAFCVLFFSISQSKLPGYILPAIPAMGFILARSCVLLAVESNKSFGLVTMGLGLFGLCACLRLGWSDTHLLAKFVAFRLMIFFVLILLSVPGIALGGIFLFRSKPSARSIALVLATVPVVATIANLGWIDPHAPVFVFSPSYLAREIQSDRIPIDDLRVSGMTRSFRFGLNFYLHREIPEWDRDTSREVYLFTGTALEHCGEQPKEMQCSDLWGAQERLDTFDVFHLIPKPLPDGATRSGQLK
jgi:4-amino-4-deoxy-L-arabinose transferase-like glycosyltransferase